MLAQAEYMRRAVDSRLGPFLEAGHATAGHNGPHGHPDTPVRNTGHYLCALSYLYKETGDGIYSEAADAFARYLYDMQSKTASGAIQCMLGGGFDKMNGLIGQGWTIEALLRYHSVFGDDRALAVAERIFHAQRYDYSAHLWHRTDLDGGDLGIDPTYNHNIWFAACAAPLVGLAGDDEAERMIIDLLTEGAARDFKVDGEGLLKHSVSLANKNTRDAETKRAIKKALRPLKFLNPRKLDYKYMEYAYQVFDMYGFCILEEAYPDLPLFHSDEYRRAASLALNYPRLNKELAQKGGGLNVYGYPYNSLAFEWPYVARHFGLDYEDGAAELWGVQCALMGDPQSGDLTRSNPDVETFDAKTYEIIRAIEVE